MAKGNIGGFVQNTTGSTDDWRVSFSSVVASGVDTANFGIIGSIGSGMTVSQASGSLLIGTGTTINAETIIRSNVSFGNDFILRYGMALSQRIVNQQFFVELVDIIGDALATTINSATSVTVTIPNHTYTAANVGQSMYLGGYVGTGTFVPGRYAIASVAANTVNFTVAGFAAGSGTTSVFGHNYHHVLYDGVTATNAKYDSQRRGYASGDSTVTISTTAAPGHSGVVSVINSLVAFADHGATGGATTIRADRTTNIPVDIDKLFLQIRAVNGSTAPASTTTATISYVSVISADVPMTTPAGSFSGSNNSPQQVQVTAGAAAMGSVTLGAGSAAIGTVAPTSQTDFALTSAASTNATVVKATAGQLFEISADNFTVTTKWLKLYRKATAPTVGTDVPILTIPIPANGQISLEFGAAGKKFLTGIGYAITGAQAVTDTTAVAAGDVHVHGTFV